MCLVTFIFYYTIEPFQIVFTVVGFLAWSFGPLVIIYKGELTFITILTTFCITVIIFLVISLLAMSIQYVIELQTELVSRNF